MGWGVCDDYLLEGLVVCRIIWVIWLEEEIDGIVKSPGSAPTNL